MKVLLNNMDNYVLVMDRDGNIKFCNEILLSKIKANKVDVVNKNIEEVIECKETNLLNLIKCIKADDKINLELTFFSKSNENVLVVCKLLIDTFEGEESIYIIGKDIYEKYYNREDLELLLDNLPFSSWIKDTDSKYIYVNEHFSQVNNLNKLDILGKYDREIWDKDISDHFTLTDKKIIKNKTPKLYDEPLIKDDVKEWFETYKAPILNEDKDVKYVIGKTKNVTIEKALTLDNANNNQKIMQLQEILNKGYNKVKSTNLLKNVGDLVYKYLEVDTLVINLYNKKTKCLEDVIKIGEDFSLLDREGLKLGDDEIEILIRSREHEGLKQIHEVNNPFLEKLMRDNNINCIGVYNIMFNDEFMGLLTLNYLDSNKIKIIRDDHLKAICNQIGTYLKNLSLSEKVSVELKKRRETERDLEDFVEISVDLVAKFMMDGQILKVNNKWTETLGWSEKDLLNMNILDLVHPDDIGKAIDIMQNTKDVYGTYINKMLCIDGSYRVLEWNYKIIHHKDFIVATAKDITNQQEEEEKRRKLEEAIKLESFKNEFFANISHEFKTPLNIILGSIQLLNRNIELHNIEDNGIYRKYATPIKQNSYRLLRLVNNLIDITRLDTGFYELQLGNYNIVNIVENITLSVAQYIEDKGRSLIFDTNCEEKIIACDPDKIERILLNLLSNAIKYTNNDGEIFVDLMIDESKVVITVKDNGIGIEEDKIESIFERFKQVDNILTRKCEGSGIGLSLVKSLVELHGGTINVHSEVGKGTEFIFELPASLVDAEEINFLIDNNYEELQIEKCNIEFSDIYV